MPVLVTSNFDDDSIKNAEIILGGNSERFAQFFAENLTENDLMGEKNLTKIWKNNTLKLYLSMDWDNLSPIWPNENFFSYFQVRIIPENE